MRYARIEDNKVINIISCDPEFLANLEGEYVEAVGEYSSVYQEPLPTPTFAENKTQKLKDLVTYTNKLHTEYLLKYPEIEITSFKDKARESALVMADDTIALTETPYLTKLGGGVIEYRNAVALAVDAKVTENAQLEAWTVQTRDAIKACTTQEELDAITW